MAIAILAWGSLIWCLGNLRIQGAWRQDGPTLPVESARISADGRLTLVLAPGVALQRTYWAVSELATLADARRNLKEREQCRTVDIHYLARDGSCADGIPAEVTTLVATWLRERPALEGVVWTGLPSNWLEKRGREFTAADGVAYIAALQAAKDAARTTHDRAREYVTNAPAFIDTDVRRQLRARGWIDTQLATTLFEPADKTDADDTEDGAGSTAS